MLLITCLSDVDARYFLEQSSFFFDFSGLQCAVGKSDYVQNEKRMVQYCIADRIKKTTKAQTRLASVPFSQKSESKGACSERVILRETPFPLLVFKNALWTALRTISRPNALDCRILHIES